MSGVGFVVPVVGVGGVLTVGVTDFEVPDLVFVADAEAAGAAKDVDVGTTGG